MHASLVGIDAVSAAFPTIPQVAAFDTAFHATLPEAAAGYGLPFEWTERWGLRRFGFHGLSVAYAVERTTDLLGAPPARLIVCHLGGGCSVTAVEGGRSVDTTMGFSPLEGMMMATRSGSVDPGVLLYLQQHCEVGVGELREPLTKRSGLRGVSGVSGDLREVLKAADGGSSRAQLAYGRFVLSIRRALGAMAAVLGGVDAVVFTGGIGENSARVRRDATSALRFAELQLAEDRNASGNADHDISAPGTRVRVLVVRAREDLAILKNVLRLRGHVDEKGRGIFMSCDPVLADQRASCRYPLESVKRPTRKPRKPPLCTGTYRPWIFSSRTPSALQRLAARGARPQRLLWASTGTKDPAYADTKYVDALVGPDTVTTLPLATLEAWRDHGRPVCERVREDPDGAARALGGLGELMPLSELRARLETEGVRKFVEPFEALHAAVEQKRHAARARASRPGARP